LAKIHEFLGETAEAERQKLLAVERLKECSNKPVWINYLTTDLLKLWYFKEFETESWFQTIQTQAKPKKLISGW